MSSADAGAQPIARLGRLAVPLLAPLAGRDFRFVWLGESVSLLGDQFNTVALAWLVLGMTGSGFALGVDPGRQRDPARASSCSSAASCPTGSRHATSRSRRTSCAPC